MSLKSHAIIAALATSAALLPVAAATAGTSPGYVDLGTFAPPASGGQFVEVNLHRGLISLISRLAAREEPDVAALLGQIESVRVNVVGLEEGNRAELAQRVASIRSQLTDAGWEQVVTAREDNEEVGVYLKTGADDVILGVTVTVLGKDDEAVFINLVGNVRPEQLAAIGDRLGLDPLKELHLENGS